MEAAVKVTYYNRPSPLCPHPPHPPPRPTPVSVNQSGMFIQMRRGDNPVRRDRRADGHNRTFGGIITPPTLPPTTSYYTISRPAGLAIETEENRRGGFRASLLPLSLLHISANISSV